MAAVLGPKQKRKFNQINEQEGRQAAQAYRSKIAERKGITLSGATPQKVGEQAQKFGYGDWSTFYANPSHDMGSASGAVASAYDLNAQQAQQNAAMNRPTQQGLYGNQLQWQQDPATGQWMRKEQLADPYQQMLGMEQQYSLQGREMGTQAMQQAQQNMQQPYNLQGISQVIGSDDMNAERSRIEQSLYDRQSSLMEPQFQQQVGDFEQMAANRGWTPGSEVYEREKKNMLDRQDQQRQQWSRDATAQGLSELEKQYGLSATERNRQIAEMEKLRYQPYNESQMFMGAGPGIQQDQFVDYGAMMQAPVDVAGTAANFYTAQQLPFLNQGKYQFEAEQSEKDRQTQLEIARMQAAKMGGGGSGLTPEQEYQLAFDYERRMRDEGLGGYYNPGGGGGGVDWGGVGNAVVSGITGAIFK